MWILALIWSIICFMFKMVMVLIGLIITIPLMFVLGLIVTIITGGIMLAIFVFIMDILEDRETNKNGLEDTKIVSSPNE